MAESTLSISYTDIQLEVGRFLGYDPTVANWTAAQVSEVDRYIQAGYRQFLYPPAVEGVEAGYEWSFLKPTTTITTIARYETGSIVVASGTCTLTGGTWPSWAATHGTLVINEVEYTVSARGGDTELTVVGDDVTAASGSWYLRHAGYQDLPDTFGRIIGDLHYAASEYSVPVVVVSENRLRTLLQSSIDEARPQYAAVRYKASDGSDGQRQEILWWPIPNEEYVLTYRYEAFTGKLVKTTAGYPLGGMKHSETIIESCIAIAEQRMNDSKGIHWDQFVRLLSTSIAQDRKNSAQYFGPMSFGEPAWGDEGRYMSRTNYPITYNGTRIN